MAGIKKKTVKELTEIIEELEKRIKKLEEKDDFKIQGTNDFDINSLAKMEDVNKLEKKLGDAAIKIESLATNVNEYVLNEKDETKLKTFKCKKCGLRFSSKDILDDHLKKDHPRKNRCNDCEDCFDESWKFEEHLKEHGKEKVFHCDKCDDTFYTEWRLGKHQTGHEAEVLKFCHYFNNFKKCPYEEYGCKFEHKESMKCRFKKKMKK